MRLPAAFWLLASVSLPACASAAEGVEQGREAFGSGALGEGPATYGCEDRGGYGISTSFARGDREVLFAEVAKRGFAAHDLDDSSSDYESASDRCLVTTWGSLAGEYFRYVVPAGSPPTSFGERRRQVAVLVFVGDDAERKRLVVDVFDVLSGEATHAWQAAP